MDENYPIQSIIQHSTFFPPNITFQEFLFCLWNAFKTTYWWSAERKYLRLFYKKSSSWQQLGEKLGDGTPVHWAVTVTQGSRTSKSTSLSRVPFPHLWNARSVSGHFEGHARCAQPGFPMEMWTWATPLQWQPGHPLDILYHVPIRPPPSQGQGDPGKSVLSFFKNNLNIFLPSFP